MNLPKGIIAFHALLLAKGYTIRGSINLPDTAVYPSHGIPRSEADRINLVIGFALALGLGLASEGQI